MDDATLDLLLRGESNRVEWKETAKRIEDVLEPACAFANDLAASGEPGYLVIGVNKQGKLVRDAATSAELDDEQQRISNRLTSTAIQPGPTFDLEAVQRDGKSLLIVTVRPYPVPPVVKVNGAAWVRQGTTTRRARDADLARLQERRPDAARPFDSRSLRDATLDDLELRDLSAAYGAEREGDADQDTFPPLPAWLATRRGLGQIVDGVWRPTAAAVLLYGRSPQVFFPGATVEFVRYHGRDVDAEVQARRTATGTLAEQLEAVWAQVAAHLDQTPLPAAGLRQAFAPRYPLEALKELVRNLVQHRLYEGTHAPGRVEWYDDRIEFSNPGGPYGRASEGEFGAHSDYRNPFITRELVALGYVQQLGRGVRRVRALLEQNGCPPLEVETDGFTRVTVRARR